METRIPSQNAMLQPWGFVGLLWNFSISFWLCVSLLSRTTFQLLSSDKIAHLYILHCTTPCITQRLSKYSLNYCRHEWNVILGDDVFPPLLSLSWSWIKYLLVVCPGNFNKSKQELGLVEKRGTELPPPHLDEAFLSEYYSAWSRWPPFLPA